MQPPPSSVGKVDETWTVLANISSPLANCAREMSMIQDRLGLDRHDACDQFHRVGKQKCYSTVAPEEQLAPHDGRSWHVCELYRPRRWQKTRQCLSSRFGDYRRWPTAGIHAVAASRAGQSALAVGPRCHDGPQPDVVNGTSAPSSVLGNPVNGGFMPQVVHRAQARPGEKQQAANPGLVPRAGRCSLLLHS